MKFQPILKNFTNRSDYHKVDLSAKTLNEKSVEVSDHSALAHYLEEVKSHKQAKVLYGGYLEKRSLYNKKELFQDKNQQRDIHLGIDFWADAGEAIICPFDGVVHSFADNIGFGNYGPCIILKHHLANQIFYTLYGHLSRLSLKNLDIGQPILKNQVFCQLGENEENGGYLPHLHFQIIQNIGNYSGDYPGVCHKNDLIFYKSNTINPVEYLGLTNLSKYH